MISEEQKSHCNKLIFEQIGKDGEFIDATAKETGIDQKIVHHAFIAFHSELYRKMYGVEP